MEKDTVYRYKFIARKMCTSSCSIIDVQGLMFVYVTLPIYYKLEKYAFWVHELRTGWIKIVIVKY